MSKYGIFGAENKEAPQLVNARILFGLSTDATLDDFKKAYRQISMKWHPDKHHGLSTFEEAGQRYSLYTAAYELHSKENKREGAQKEFSKSLEEPFIVGDRVFLPRNFIWN
jgi:curved DNA-binding protein CbpA